MKEKGGVVLFETLWLVLLFFVLLTVIHLELLREWHERFTQLQRQRLPYHGEIVE